jgi:hypothetical protein
MTHALARRRRAPRDEPGDRLLEVLFDPGRSLLLGVAPDFADENRPIGIGVFVEA